MSAVLPLPPPRHPLHHTLAYVGTQDTSTVFPPILASTFRLWWISALEFCPAMKMTRTESNHDIWESECGTHFASASALWVWSVRCCNDSVSRLGGALTWIRGCNDSVSRLDGALTWIRGCNDSVSRLGNAVTWIRCCNDSVSRLGGAVTWIRGCNDSVSRLGKAVSWIRCRNDSVSSLRLDGALTLADRWLISGVYLPTYTTVQCIVDACLSVRVGSKWVSDWAFVLRRLCCSFQRNVFVDTLLMSVVVSLIYWFF